MNLLTDAQKFLRMRHSSELLFQFLIFSGAECRFPDLAQLKPEKIHSLCPFRRIDIQLLQTSFLLLQFSVEISYLLFLCKHLLTACIQDLQMLGRFQKGGLFMLCMEIDQDLRRLPKPGQGNRLPVDPVQDPVIGKLPGNHQFILSQQILRKDLPLLKLLLHRRFQREQHLHQTILCIVTQQRLIELSSERDTDSSDHHGLSCTGLSGQHIQSFFKCDLEPVDQCDIFYS